MRKANLAVLIAMLMGLSASCSFEPEAVVALGTLEVDRIEVTAETSEAILDVFVTEGDLVNPGDPLMRQDPARIHARLKRAEADLDIARARFRAAESGPRAQDIAAARALVAAMASDLKTARIELDREQALVQQKLTSQNNVDILAGRVDFARAKQQEAEAVLAQLIEGTRSEEIDIARSSLGLMQAEVEDITLSLERTTLRSMVTGIVEAVLSETGERPVPGRPVVIIAAAKPPYARVHLPQPVRTRLKPGAKAQVQVDGHDAGFAGTVRWIAHEASFTPYYALTQRDRSHLSYLAEIELTDAGPLSAGIPVSVTFPEL